MIQALIINAVKRAITRAVEKKMLKALLNKSKGKLTYAGGIAFAVGAFAQVLGIDIAPTEVDAIVSFLATVAVIYGRYRATKA